MKNISFFLSIDIPALVFSTGLSMSVGHSGLSGIFLLIFIAKSLKFGLKPLIKFCFMFHSYPKLTTVLTAVRFWSRFRSQNDGKALGLCSRISGHISLLGIFRLTLLKSFG